MHEASNYLKELGLCVSVYSQCVMGLIKHGKFEILINVEEVLELGKSR